MCKCIYLSLKINCKDRKQYLCILITWFVFLSVSSDRLSLRFLINDQENAGLTLWYCCLCLASVLLPMRSSLSQRFNFSLVTSVRHTQSERPSAATDMDLIHRRCAIKALIKTPDAAEIFSFSLRSRINLKLYSLTVHENPALS